MIVGGGVLFLARHELRLVLRRNLGSAFARIIFAASGVALLVGGYFVAKLMAIGHPGGSAIAIAAVGAIMALFSTFMIAQSLVAATNAVHERSDLDLLLSSPLPPWRIISIRMISVALKSASLYVIMAGAVCVYLPFYGAWRWMAILPAILALSLASTSISLVLASYLLNAIGPRRTRQIAQVVSAIIAAAFLLAVQSVNLLSTRQEVAVAERMQAWFASPPINPTSPLWLPARAALGEPEALAMWVGGSILIFAIALRVFAQRFVADAAAAIGEAPRRRLDRRVRRMEGGLRNILIRKELRLIARNPGLLGVSLLPLIYLAPIAIPLLRSEQSFEIAAFSTQAFIIVQLLAILADGVARITILGEDAPDLLATAPVASETATDAKVIAASLSGVLIATAIAAAVFAERPWSGILLTIGATFAIACACLLQVWFHRPIGRKLMRTQPGGSLVAATGFWFVSFGFAAATALAVAGSAFALIPFLAAIGLMALLRRLAVWMFKDMA